MSYVVVFICPTCCTHFWAPVGARAMTAPMGVNRYTEPSPATTGWDRRARPVGAANLTSNSAALPGPARGDRHVRWTSFPAMAQAGVLARDIFVLPWPALVTATAATRAVPSTKPMARAGRPRALPMPVARLLGCNFVMAAKDALEEGGNCALDCGHSVYVAAPRP
jgi:hypothetical protein